MKNNSEEMNATINRPDEKDSNNSDLVTRMNFDALVAEYNSLRDEQIELIKIQNHLYNYLLIIIGTIITVLITIISKPEIFSMAVPVAFWIIMLLPIAISQISFLFFDHELVIHAIGSHLFHNVRPKINKLTGNEEHLASIWDVNYLNVSTRSVHRNLHALRWMLFLLPSILAVVVIPYLIFGESQLWDKYLSGTNRNASFVLRYFICPAIWIIDLIAVYRMVVAEQWARWKHNQQKLQLIETGEFEKYVKDGKFVKWLWWQRIFFELSPEDKKLMQESKEKREIREVELEPDK